MKNTQPALSWPMLLALLCFNFLCFGCEKPFKCSYDKIHWKEGNVVVESSQVEGSSNLSLALKSNIRKLEELLPLELELRNKVDILLSGEEIAYVMDSTSAEIARMHNQIIDNICSAEQGVTNTELTASQRDSAFSDLRIFRKQYFDLLLDEYYLRSQPPGKVQMEDNTNNDGPVSNHSTVTDPVNSPQSVYVQYPTGVLNPKLILKPKGAVVEQEILYCKLSLLPGHYELVLQDENEQYCTSFQIGSKPQSINGLNFSDQCSD